MLDRIISLDYFGIVIDNIHRIEWSPLNYYLEIMRRIGSPIYVCGNRALPFTMPTMFSSQHYIKPLANSDHDVLL